VCAGIKESVLRLDQRDLHVLMSHSGLAGDTGSSTHPQATSGYSPGNSRSTATYLSQSMGASYSHSFSPHGVSRAPQAGHPGAPPHGPPPRDHKHPPAPHPTAASAGSLAGAGGPEGAGSGPNSPHNSMKFPSLHGTSLLWTTRDLWLQLFLEALSLH
jgi:hypothetical protein